MWYTQELRITLENPTLIPLQLQNPIKIQKFLNKLEKKQNKNNCNDMTLMVGVDI